MSGQDSTEQQQQQQQASISSTSTSISLIKLDELSSFGATKQNRLPTLIRLNQETDSLLKSRQTNSMPEYTADQLELEMVSPKQQTSLPTNLIGAEVSQSKSNQEVDQLNKENQPEEEDFQLVDMVGPSLPQPDPAPGKNNDDDDNDHEPMQTSSEVQHHPLNISQQLLSHPNNVGDSLIEMIINLRNENQNLVRALETNNEYVKERINEFKRANEEAKKREAQFALEKADHEHQVRKLQRQNTVLSERLKSLESKLSSMKLEVNQSLDAARSSKASSIEHQNHETTELYPALGDGDSFSNQALNETTTMQIDATNSELLHGTGIEGSHLSEPTASQMDTTEPTTSSAARVSSMNRDELNKHFDANKAEMSDDDPMKQCDRLEKQLNDIGKRDYEICLLQQQLNIYRQDFRFERMEKLEAKIQIEKLKNDIDKLCLERLKDRTVTTARGDEDNHLHNRTSYSRRSGSGVRFDPAAAADAVISKLGHHVSKKAAKSAAKAAKYASKQAHREEKAAAAAAAAASAASNAAAYPTGNPSATESEYHGHRRHHHHHNRHHRGSGVRSEVVNDLLSTANKAMLTGYKMASTHVNLALDKLSQFEQQQAANLAANKPPPTSSAPPMDHYSVD